MITVATWNLENLFRPDSDAGPESEATYEAKLKALAETITELAPDVLAVQEVGEPEALGDLVDRLAGTWHTALANQMAEASALACSPASRSTTSSRWWTSPKVCAPSRLTTLPPP